ncbi:MAG: NYN domain-containing protein [Promethearchaeota archaeon]
MKKFLKLLKENRNIVGIYYYECVDISKIHKKKVYYQILRERRVIINTIPLKKRSDGRLVEKGIDTLIAKDLLIFTIKDLYDTAILVSGDGDFIPIIDERRSYGKKVEVWAFKHTIGKDLKNKANKYAYLDNFIDKIKL